MYHGRHEEMMDRRAQIKQQTLQCRREKNQGEETVMNIKPIKTEADHKQALARLELLMDAKPDTPEGDELDILATLVDAYERQHHKIESPRPVEAIRFRMEQMGLVDSDQPLLLGGGEG